MALWMWVLLAVGAVSVVARLLGAPPLIVFVLSAAGIIPMAGLIGRATEDLAHHIGPKFGGLLNATFGNAAELIIAGLASSATRCSCWARACWSAGCATARSASTRARRAATRR
jgi:Ca2+:H+ antiporter